LKLLLDTCLSVQARGALQAAGHDVIWGGDWQEDPGDEAILALACKEGRVLVTLDRDFGELAVLQGASHCGILRLVDFSVRHQAAACLKIIADHATELEEGCVITAQPGRIRIRQTGK
jgi:predicted nuclease of predicted toxin-antitoxin system